MCDLCTAVQVANEIHEQPLPAEQKYSFGYVEQVINNYIQYMNTETRNRLQVEQRTKEKEMKETGTELEYLERNRDKMGL
jgi:hypothetical protein